MTLMKNLEASWKEKTDFWANNAINYCLLYTAVAANHPTADNLEMPKVLCSVSRLSAVGWFAATPVSYTHLNVHHDCIYNICPAVIYPRMKVIPELTRNGFKEVSRTKKRILSSCGR